jgi:CARDB protein
VFERERTDPQTDIEFDFFDESPTAESSSREGGRPRRRRRLPTRPPAPPGGPQLYRLGILIAGLIILAVILILAVNSCRANQKQSAYKNYVADVGDVATQSEALGKQLNTRLTTPGIKLEELRGDVEGFRQQQEQILRKTQDLTPPGPLVEQQESLIEAMQFRVNGLDGLAQAFAKVAQTSNTEEAGRLLAQQASRLLASDVVYDDLFKEGTSRVLDEQGVTNVAVPDSNFLQGEDLASPDTWELIVRRLTQGPTAGGLHGNGIVEVRAQPGGQVLSQGADNTVKASEKLAFQVRVQNSGDNQETQVPVTLTIQQDPVIRKRKVIERIDPDETKTVTFTGFGTIDFTGGSVLKVIVEPVAGEQNTSNNTAQYTVIFTLG